MQALRSQAGWCCRCRCSRGVKFYRLRKRVLPGCRHSICGWAISEVCCRLPNGPSPCLPISTRSSSDRVRRNPISPSARRFRKAWAACSGRRPARRRRGACWCPTPTSRRFRIAAPTIRRSRLVLIAVASASRARSSKKNPATRAGFAERESRLWLRAMARAA